MYEDCIYDTTNLIGELFLTRRIDFRNDDRIPQELFATQHENAKFKIQNVLLCRTLDILGVACETRFGYITLHGIAMMIIFVRFPDAYDTLLQNDMTFVFFDEKDPKFMRSNLTSDDQRHRTDIGPDKR